MSQRASSHSYLTMSSIDWYEFLYGNPGVYKVPYIHPDRWGGWGGEINLFFDVGKEINRRSWAKGGLFRRIEWKRMLWEFFGGTLEISFKSVAEGGRLLLVTWYLIVDRGSGSGSISKWNGPATLHITYILHVSQKPYTNRNIQMTWCIIIIFEKSLKDI